MANKENITGYSPLATAKNVADHKANSYAHKYYRTFSGTDTLVYALMEGGQAVVLGSLTTFSYSMFRVRKPVEVLGMIVPKGHTSGVRVVAGTMIFTLLNRHFVRDLLDKYPYLKEYGKLKADELPPMDLMIVSSNEYGASMTMMVMGANFTDEGQVLSIEDMFTEQQFSLVAKDINEADFYNFIDLYGKTDDRFNSQPEVDLGIEDNVVQDTVLDIFLDGIKLVPVYAEPYIDPATSSTMIPVRDVFESLGYTVGWDQDEGEFILTTADGKKEGRVKISTGRAHGDIFPTERVLNPLPLLRETSTGVRSYVPLRDLLEFMGYTVVWDGQLYDIHVTSPSGESPNVDTNVTLTKKEIQQRLNAHTHGGLAIDGSIGPLTKQQLKIFCQSKGLSYTSITDFNNIHQDIIVALKMPGNDAPAQVDPPASVDNPPAVDNIVQLRNLSRNNLLIYGYPSDSAPVVNRIGTNITFKVNMTQSAAGFMKIESPHEGYAKESEMGGVDVWR